MLFFFSKKCSCSMRNTGLDTVVTERISWLACRQARLQVSGGYYQFSRARAPGVGTALHVCQRLSQTRLCCSHFAYSSLASCKVICCFAWVQWVFPRSTKNILHFCNMVRSALQPYQWCIQHNPTSASVLHFLSRGRNRDIKFCAWTSLNL